MTNTPNDGTSPPWGRFKVKLKKPTEGNPTDVADLYLGSNAEPPGCVMQWVSEDQALEFASEDPERPSTWRVINRPGQPLMHALSREPTNTCIPYRVHVTNPSDDSAWRFVGTPEMFMLAYELPEGMTVYVSNERWAWDHDRGNINLVPRDNEAYMEIV